MKLPVTIVLLLFVIATISILFINLDDNYYILDNNQYISPERGFIKLNTELYFVSGITLRRETRSMMIGDLNYAKAIIDELSKGSQNSYFKSIFDYKLTINSIDLVNETCYINVSDDEELRAFLKLEDLSLYIWSVVNSLTENNQIKNVQFLFDGKRITMPLRGYNLNSPLSKLGDLVYLKVITPSDVVLDFLEYINTRRFDLAYSLLTKNSMYNYDYNVFVKYANSFNETHRGYILESYYSRQHQNYDDVFVKYKKQFDSDETVVNIFDKWYLEFEDDNYRINLNAN